ncbi:MAG: protein CapI [Flavobacteriaceae bacterium]|nr:protein CapI [Flavobacteriaceae bacterium]|tara:strand:- start:1935 stop:2924 length:990 start_codon:yes stop_codon:yes gene_type:complete
MKVLVTGAAGFIGFHLTLALLGRNDKVVGIDNLNEYYDPALKQLRLDEIAKHPKCSNFEFIKADISDRVFMEKLFADHSFDIVVNLAAQAGVRYSLENPHDYVKSNLVGFVNILEGCRHSKVKHLVYASSSSVYGMNSKQPFSVTDNTDYPISLYAATKKSNELLAHSYSHLFNIPSTGLRFFTVYGPFGRPDMAYYSFTQAIDVGRPIDVFNHGDMKRDFTYIDDIVEGILRVMTLIPITQANDTSIAKAPYRLLNIGNNNPVTLRRFISAIENSLGKKAIENLLPMQAGDMLITYADINPLSELCGFQPSTSIEDGIDKFVDWYRVN